MHEKSISEPWKRIADMWKTHFTSPSRISPGELKKYREWLSRLNSRRGQASLVLGATPELRDVLAEFGYINTIVDINPEMVRAMDSLLKEKNPKEKVIIANWLNNGIPDHSFDVIVGDAVFPNVPWENWPDLLSEVSRLLKPGGTFINRAFCAPKKKPFGDMADLFDAFSRKQASYRSALEFTLEVMDMEYDHKTHKATFKASRDLLESIGWDKGIRTGKASLDEILRVVWDFWITNFGDKVFIYAYRDEEEKLYRKRFSIKETYESPDNPYANITPMYMMKPVSG